MLLLKSVWQTTLIENAAHRKRNLDSGKSNSRRPLDRILRARKRAATSLLKNRSKTAIERWTAHGWVEASERASKIAVWRLSVRSVRRA